MIIYSHSLILCSHHFEVSYSFRNILVTLRRMVEEKLFSTTGRPMLLFVVIMIALLSSAESSEPLREHRSPSESKEIKAVEPFNTVRLNDMEASYLRLELNYIAAVDHLTFLRGLSRDDNLLNKVAASLEQIRQDLDEQRRLVDKAKILKDFIDFVNGIHLPLLLLYHKRDIHQYSARKQLKLQRTRQSQVDETTQNTHSSRELNASVERFVKRLNETDFQSKSELFISWICYVFGLTDVNIIPPESMEEVADESGAPILIGGGGNGEIRLMRMKHNDQIYAVKTQHWHLDNFAAAQNFVNEVRALRALQGSNNFPTFIGVTSSQYGGHYPAIVQEFVGELISYRASSISLHKAIWDIHISRLESLKMAADVNRALQYMHKKNWLHRDLKSDNILLKLVSRKNTSDDLGGNAPRGEGTAFENPKKTFAVKLVDFGTTINLNEPEEYLLLPPESQKILLEYSPHIAPEVVEGQRPYSKSSDVFSLGFVLHGLSFAGEDFLSYLGDQCTEPNPEDRPELDDVIALLDFWMRIRPVYESV